MFLFRFTTLKLISELFKHFPGLSVLTLGFEHVKTTQIVQNWDPTALIIHFPDALTLALTPKNSNSMFSMVSSTSAKVKSTNMGAAQ